jgi:ABC-2 type transport system ATP-binding protein
VPADALRERVPALIDLVGLTPHRDKRVQNFSKGMLQRIGLAQALIHEPELIFLDEPTSGLDPMGRRLVRDIIRAQRDRGATVFLNSHLLSEIEITCDEVVFIRDGEVVTSRDLRTANGEETRVVVRARKLTPEAIAGLAPWSTSTLLEEEQLTLTTRSQDVLPDILRHLVAAGADVYQFTPQRLSLEDLFLKIMGEDRGL